MMLINYPEKYCHDLHFAHGREEGSPSKLSLGPQTAGKRQNHLQTNICLSWCLNLLYFINKCSSVRQGVVGDREWACLESCTSESKA